MVTHSKIELENELDTAATIIFIISAQGSKKDFVDLYILLKKYKLSEVLKFFHNKYRDYNYNPLQPLRSLVYFTDAEDDLMPDIFFKVTWLEVKKFFKKEVPIIAKKLIGLS